jgi:hypothetical protein
MAPARPFFWIESQCSHCDRFGIFFLGDKPPEQIIVRERLGPQRMIAGSARHKRVVQLTTRMEVADDPFSRSQSCHGLNLVMVSIPSCSHHDGSGLVQPRYIISHEFDDFHGVRALLT